MEDLDLIAKIEAPILADLHQVGLDYGSLQHMMLTCANWAPAVPVLLRWLPQVTHEGMRTHIIRALSVPWARPQAAPMMVEEMRHGSEHFAYRSAVANCLGIVGDQTIVDDLVSLALDKQYGMFRAYLIDALDRVRRCKDPAAALKAETTLMELLKDAEIAGPTLSALRRRRAMPQEAVPLIEELTNHPEQWVRKSALAALARVHKK